MALNLKSASKLNTSKTAKNTDLVEAKKAAKELVVKVHKKIPELSELVPVPQKVQLYRYLAAVYVFGRKLKLTGNDRAQEKLAQLTPQLRMKGGINRFRILLAMSSTGKIKPKQRDRYARALQSAHKQGVKGDDFLNFIEDNGVNNLGDREVGKKPKKKKPRKNSEWV